MTRISVIVPVYNGEDYIERCIDSILNQTYSDIEIIIINDGSRDKTRNIISKYEGDSKVSIINKENEGVSKSRNIGIQKATGDYIYFCDADDWIEPNCFELGVLEIENFDFLRFGHNVVIENKITMKENCDDILSGVELLYDNNKEIIRHLLTNETEGHLWNYILKTDIIKKNKISFKEDVFYQEDVIFLLEYFLKIKKGKIISPPLYNYVKNEKSATGDLNKSTKNLSLISVIRKYMCDVLIKNGKTKYSKYLDQRFLNLQLSYFLNYQDLISKKRFSEFISVISKSNYAYYNEMLKNKMSIKWKVFIWLLKNNHSLLLYYYLVLYKAIAK